MELWGWDILELVASQFGVCSRWMTILSIVLRQNLLGFVWKLTWKNHLSKAHGSTMVISQFSFWFSMKIYQCFVINVGRRLVPLLAVT